jgi:inosine-uridine nucleoside N-ribohydrolase
VVVIGLGALTNVAEALALDPGIVSNMVRMILSLSLDKT